MVWTGRFNEGPVLIEENILLFGSNSHDWFQGSIGKG